MATSADNVFGANDGPSLNQDHDLREDDDDDDDDFEDALADFGHLAVSGATDDSEMDDLGLPVFYTPVSTFGATSSSIDNYYVDNADMNNSAEFGSHATPSGSHRKPQGGGSHHVTCEKETRDDDDPCVGTSATAHSSQSTRDDDDDDDGATDVGDVAVQDGEDDEEEHVRRIESLWTEEEKEEKKSEASALKSRGNEAFKAGDYETADEYYTEALSLCPTCFSNDRSIMYSNRSACKLRLGDNSAAITDCSKALKLNPQYVKCLLRRAELYEKTEKLDEALGDFKNVYELDHSIHEAGSAILRLEQAINERNEKMKEEMLAQLKNLGNMILKPFGLSTDNFQLQQNSESGGYSVNFKR